MSILDKSSHKIFDEQGSRLLVEYEKNKSSNNNPHLPPWFNLKKFRRIKPLVNQYFFSIFLAHFCGLLILVFIRSIYQTLSKTGKSKNLVTIFYRYLHTCLFVKKWYEGQIWIENDPAYQSLQMVKNMHQTVSDQQNKGRIDENDEKSISLRDMTLTQFAFAGLLVLSPKKYGFSNRKEDIETMIYFWSVIGYMLGIDDDYNLFIGDDVETIRQRCWVIFRENFRPSLLSVADTTTNDNDDDRIRMARQIIESSNQYIYGLRYGSCMKFIWQSLQIESEYPLLNREEKFWYYQMKIVIEKCYQFTIVRFLLNQLLRLSFYLMQFDFMRGFKIRQLSQMDHQVLTKSPKLIQ